MAVSQPLATDPQNAPSHSLQHRQIATDPTAPVMSVQVLAAGTMDAGYGVMLKTKTITVSDSAYSAAEEYTIFCNAVGGTITVNLPAAATNAGRIYNIKKIDSSQYTVIIDGNASETIDGDLTKTITAQWVSVMLHCNGTNWYII
jgi:hypothetical protein